MINKLTNLQKQLRRQVIEASYQRHLSHLGSCLTAIDLITAVYKVKKTSDLFVLSNGHAALAWYVVLNHQKIISTKTICQLFVHPDRNIKNGIPVSTGSLGHGLPIAVGLALADRSRQIYCLISDGECAEGSIWEALNLAQQLQLKNLHIVINANGWGAYDKVHLPSLIKKIRAIGFLVLTKNGHDLPELIRTLKQRLVQTTVVVAKTNNKPFSFLNGQDAHYHLLTEDEYQLALELLT